MAKILLDRLITHSPEQTAEFGKNFALRLSPSDVIAFKGSLGSGKTTCIRAICEGLQVAEIVTSPTFTLINEYHGRFPVYHFDFYRIHDVRELEDLGVLEYFYGDGICLVEWPELVEELLPPHHFLIRLYHANEMADFGKLLHDTDIGSSDHWSNNTKINNEEKSVGVPEIKRLSPNDRLIEVYEYDRTRH